MIADTAEVLSGLGVDDLAPTARVGSLSVAHQQIVEIAKALSQGPDLICMDEPTAALADAEVALLYRLVERLKERGVAVLYVSHRLREIFDLCDRITILKDGRLVEHRRDRRHHPRRTRDEDGRPAHRGPLPRPAARHRDRRCPAPDRGRRQRLRRRHRPRRSRRRDRGPGRPPGLAAAPRSREAVFGIAPFTRGQISVDGRAGADLPSPQGHRRRDRARHRGPQGRGPGAATSRCGPTPAWCSTRTPSSTPGSARRASATSSSSLDLVARGRRPGGPVPVGRQPAEGRARQVARGRARRHRPRRAHPRHRRRAPSTSSTR